MTASGGFDGCMVDRWTRNPFTHQPGYSEDYIVSHEAAQQESEALLLNRTREAGIWLVGGGEDVDAISSPGFFKGHTDQAIQQQMELASRGQGLMASYKPGSEGAAFTSTLAKFLIGGETLQPSCLQSIAACVRHCLERMCLKVVGFAFACSWRASLFWGWFVDLQQHVAGGSDLAS